MPEPYSETPKQKSPKSSANPNNNGSPNIMSRQEYEEIIKSEYLKFPSPNSLQQRSLVGTEGELPTKWNGEPGRIFFDVFQQQVLQKMSSKELKAFITENM